MAPPDIALQYLVPIPMLMALSLALCTLRIWTRFRARKMYLGDWLIIVAEVLSLTGFSFSIAAFAHGWGHPLSTFTPEERSVTFKLRFISATIWMVTICFVRLSIASSLLRFGQELLWRWTLYFIMGLQIIISTCFFIFQFIQCRPISVNWKTVPDAKCWPIKPQVIVAWIVSGIYILMDLILALMPIRFIRTLSRPMNEKILIGILMSTGLLATAMLCAKLTTMSMFGKGDPMKSSIRLVMWTKLEEQVGIIASCLPTLKALAERALRKINLLTTRFHNTRPSFVNPYQISLDDTPKDQKGSEDESSYRQGTGSDSV